MARLVVIVVIFAALATILSAFARAVLLPFARALQKRRGYSDLFVTDLAVVAPLALGILIFTSLMAWLWSY